MMTWEQARQLVGQGHIVGSHTVSHPNLAHLEDEPELRFELEESKRRLGQELASPAIHFSYPCPILQPHWSARSTQICRELGYRTAVTTNSGPVRVGDDPLTLHRLPASKDVDELRWALDCTFLGRAM
jgi:peptidoglycan/xylan/chitin deacetylase (PgdA/CDA1 family)